MVKLIERQKERIEYKKDNQKLKAKRPEILSTVSPFFTILLNPSLFKIVNQYYRTQLKYPEYTTHGGF